MNVSFSGLKNATSTFIINEQPYNILRSGFSFYVPEGKDILLNVQLDNNGDKDLENFKEILKKFPPKIGKDFVSFSFEEQQVPGRKRDFKYFKPAPNRAGFKEKRALSPLFPARD